MKSKPENPVNLNPNTIVEFNLNTSICPSLAHFGPSLFKSVIFNWVYSPSVTRSRHYQTSILAYMKDNVYNFALANRFVIKTQYDLSVFDVNSKVKLLTLSVCMYLFHQIKEIKKQKLS